MDLAEQMAYFDAHKERAFEDCLQLLMDNRKLILAKARFRMEVNFQAFRDQSWHRSPEDIREEVLQEAADMPGWRVIGMYCEEHHNPTVPDPWEEYGNEEDSPVAFEADPRLVAFMNDADQADD